MAATKELLADASAYVQSVFNLEQVAASSSGSGMLGNPYHKIQKITKKIHNFLCQSLVIIGTNA